MEVQTQLKKIYIPVSNRETYNFLSPQLPPYPLIIFLHHPILHIHTEPYNSQLIVNLVYDDRHKPEHV